MLLLELPPQPVHETEDADALIKEARRLRRRRWAIGTLSLAALIGVAASIVALTGSPPPAPSTAQAGASAGVLPNGPLTTLNVAGPLAVAPDGALYVADDPGTGIQSDDRVLVRLHDGHFRVIAGTGTRGFSGDGGPAVKAELSDISDLAVAPAGALYIADGGRIRMVSRDGVIRTIAGSGRPARTIANGAPALSAALGPPLSIALSPAGQLYISTGSPSGSPPSQILRLTAAGTLDPVRAIVKSATGGNRADQMARGKQLSDFGAITIDGRGDIYAAGGPGGYGVWQITPNGNAHLVSGSYLTQRVDGRDPLLEYGPQGAVYAATARGIFHVEPHKLVPIATFNKPLSRSLHRHPLSPLYFATSATGTLYADDNGPTGYQLKSGYGTAFLQHLVSISNGHTTLLWQEHSKTAK
jgi:hypothetical protein